MRKITIQKKQLFDIVKPCEESFFEITGEDPYSLVEEISKSVPKQYSATFAEEMLSDHKQFYFRIEKYRENKFIQGEISIGHLESRKNKVYIVRDRHLQKADPDNSLFTSSPDSKLTSELQDGDLFLASSLHPQDQKELLIFPHTLIVSTPDYLFSPLTLDEYSIVGRLEGNSAAIPISSLGSLIVDNPAEQEGSIAYDKSLKCLKFFNGKEWRKLKDEKI